MKKKQIQWKSFNINMPDELKPIYDFLQDELNFILSNDETRAVLDNIDTYLNLEVMFGEI